MTFMFIGSAFCVSGLKMALLRALCFSLLFHLSSGAETISCPALAGVPGSPGHNGLPGRDGRDGHTGSKGDKGEMGPSGYGVPGKIGPAGPLGSAGPKGQKGELGSPEELEEKIKNLIKEILQEQPKVAFWATLSCPMSSGRTIGPFEDNRTLVYESALTNFGNAYNSNTGVFTAPVRGVYYFSVVLFNAYPPAAGLHIMKNGARVAIVTDNPPGEDTEDTASNSFTLLLEKGDRIYNELMVNRKVYTDAGGRNSFSGHLLYAIPNTD